MCVLTATRPHRRHRGERTSPGRSRCARGSCTLLKEKENEIAHATRFSLVSGTGHRRWHMRSIVADASRSPCTGALGAGNCCASRRSTCHEREKNPATTLVAEIDLASGIVHRMRVFIRRGRPHVSTVDVASLFDDTR